MKLVLLQTDIVWANPAENIARAERLINQTAPADLYVLPEMWATGFATQPSEIAEREGDALSLEWMRRTAEARQCALCGSLSVQTDDGRFHNRCYFVTPSSVTFYDKHHLFTYGHEDEYYTAGIRQVVVSWKGFRFLLLVCYDLRFPVWSRWGRAGEYDAILLVANWPAKRQLAWDTLVRARAIENQSYVVAVNRVGTDNLNVDYEGGSMVIDPVGRTVAAGKKNVEQALEATLDMSQLQKMRRHFQVLADRD